MFESSSVATSGASLVMTQHALSALALDYTPLGGSEAALIDMITSLEKLKSAAAAAQARLAAEISSRRANAQGARGLGSEIALARRESPHKGSRLLGLATALVHEMPHTYRALAMGEISEWRATLMVRETAVLTLEDRAEVDRRMAGKLTSWGDKQIANKARALGYQLDPGSAIRRVRGAASDRRVGLRPAPDTMTYLTGFLPVQAGAACWAALTEAADRLRSAGDERSRGQIMADTLVERITGSAATGPGLPVSLNVTMTDLALLGDSDEAAHLQGIGPIPAFVAREIVREADKVWLTRLFTRPGSDELIAMEQRGRVFTGQLRKFLILRDDVCSTPWCDAPVRHIDHIQRHADGGPTSADNAQGLCVTCNLTKEAPGWQTERDPDVRQIRITTPAGVKYGESPPPQLRVDSAWTDWEVEIEAA